MWSFIGKKEKNLDAVEKLQGILGDAWIWIAFDAVTKIVLAYVIGKRTLSHAVSLLEEVKRVTADMPELFSSDQLDHYANALLQVYGNIVVPTRKPGAGRPPNQRLIPPKNLNYVHVVKEYKENRVHKVSHKVIYGNAGKISEILKNSVVSRKINTSYVERNNGTIRHMDARCSRKTYRFSKIKENHEQILIKLTQVFEGGIRKGLFRNMDPYLMATGLEGFTHAFLLQYLDYGDEHPFDAGTVTKMFFKSILLNTDVTSDLGNSV